MKKSLIVANAYDAIASDYDRQLQGDEWMRTILWERYRQFFQPGQSVLDVACGTGIDSLYLAQRGIHITAVDISPRMIAELEAKASRQKLAGALHTRILDLAGEENWPSGPFEGLISAFAGLNTVSDPAHFARQAASRLRPQGHLLLHMLNQVSLWELLPHLVHGRWRTVRELGRRQERIVTIGEQAVAHQLYRPYDFYGRYFADQFQLRRITGLGILRPPQSHRHLSVSLMPWLDSVEQWIRDWRPFVNWGRFFLLEMEKR